MKLKEIKTQWSRIVPTLEVNRLELIKRLADQYLEACNVLPDLNENLEEKYRQWQFDFDSLTDNERWVYETVLSSANQMQALKEAIDRARGQLNLFEIRK